MVRSSWLVMHTPSRQSSPGRALRITPSERRALQLLASGHTTIDVAAGLGISAPETETLLTALFTAMGAAGRAEAVAAAHRRGLLT
jgi:DNA-binding CsgD family transcriptional regulator